MNNDDLAFVFIDPSLKSYNGHFFNYDDSLSGELIKNCTRGVYVLSHNDCIDFPGAKFINLPCFRDGLESDKFKALSLNRFPLLKNIRNYILGKRFSKDLERGLLNLQTEFRNLVIFMHTTTPLQLEQFATFINKRQHSIRKLFVMLRYAPSPNPFMPMAGSCVEYKNAFNKLKTIRDKSKLILMTDSKILVREYSYITDLTVHLYPIPHTQHVNENLKKSTPNVISYLGNARATKGFQYLPSLVEKSQKSSLMKDWNFAFQANVMFERDLESCISVSRLRKLPVTLYENELTVKEYNDLLSNSRIVLIPYQSLYYYAQTSGVLVEALSLGIPVLVPKGTWMSSVIKDARVGVDFAPGDISSMYDGLHELISNIEYYERNAREFKSEWCAMHNPQLFVGLMMGQL